MHKMGPGKKKPVIKNNGAESESTSEQAIMKAGSLKPFEAALIAETSKIVTAL